MKASFFRLSSGWLSALLLIVLLSTPGLAQQTAPSGRAQDAGTGADRTCYGSFDAATRDNEAFNRTFRHECVGVRDVRMHYVVGGQGEPLVLLHGWPQTWYEWFEIMPALAERYTVIAVDLPGLGDSEGSPVSYDKRTLAGYVHDLVSNELGYDRINLVAHDIGAGVGYQYAAQFPGEVERFVFMDYPLPGPGVTVDELSAGFWHFAFHRVEEVPELLTAGQEYEYLEHWYPEVAASPDAISEEAVTEFARTYSDPNKMSGGFDLYRTLDEDAEDNTRSARTTLEMPVLVMSASIWPEDLVAGTVRPVAENVQAVTVPNAGHWLSEENPEFVIEELLRFLDGGS